MKSDRTQITTESESLGRDIFEHLRLYCNNPHERHIFIEAILNADGTGIDQLNAALGYIQELPEYREFINSSKITSEAISSHEVIRSTNHGSMLQSIDQSISPTQPNY